MKKLWPWNASQTNTKPQSKTKRRETHKRWWIYLRVRHNVIVIVAEATGATHELPKHGVSERVPTPAIWVPPFDLLGLFPALFLHTVREASWVVVVVIGHVVRDEVAVEERDSRCEPGGTRLGRGWALGGSVPHRRWSPASPLCFFACWPHLSQLRLALSSPQLFTKKIHILQFGYQFRIWPETNFINYTTGHAKLKAAQLN